QRDAPLSHVETPLARLLEHARGEIDALRRASEAGDTPEQQPRAAAAFENVGVRAVTRDELDLQIVDECVVGPCPTVIFVTLSEVVVVGAGLFEVRVHGYILHNKRACRA